MVVPSRGGISAYVVASKRRFRKATDSTRVGGIPELMDR